MKVFISWSGQHSRKLGEALRDWLPAVLQLVAPYFTPSDIEKGTSWLTDISAHLTESKIGILCITRENIHSDWLLFEAGALSKNLEKVHVCPILFGISNTDLAGPLKQFQTTEFEKQDILRLLGVINGCLGENKLTQKTLDTVFEKWWPDLNQKIVEILNEVEEPEGPVRSDRSLLEEILQMSRVTATRARISDKIAPEAIKDLLTHYIELHDNQATEQGDYQDVLDILRKMRKAVVYISNKSRKVSPELDELIDKLRELSYTTEDHLHDDGHDDNPF